MAWCSYWLAAIGRDRRCCTRWPVRRARSYGTAARRLLLSPIAAGFRRAETKFISRHTMGQFMRSVFRLSIEFGLMLAFAGAARAQLPAGAGREETLKVCSSCHEVERAVSLRQDRDGWKTTINKMIGLGATATEQELTAALEYLAEHYPAATIP